MESSWIAPDSDELGPRDAPPRARDRSAPNGARSHPEAQNAAAALSPTSPSPRKERRRRSRRQLSTLSARDRAVLLALARCRILSFDQLRRLVFVDRSPQRVGQCLAALEAGGWLRIWEDVSKIGGRPRYALPTRRALAFAQVVLSAESIDAPSARLAALLLRSTPRRPLVLTPRATPAFLAHQRECNDLLIGFGRIPQARLLWATSFDRPFPHAAHGITFPQPDYILVIEDAAGPALVFGEHDRGHESLVHFRRTKAERYAALAARPQLMRALFGFERFSVWVTVLDARAGAPLRRLRSLVAVARASAASDVMAYTLAGWVATTPGAPIWFCDGAMPDARTLKEAKASPGLRALPTHAPLQSDRVGTRTMPRISCATADDPHDPPQAAMVH